MNTAVKNIILRVIKNRMAAGENLDDIIKSYPGLTDEDINEVRAALME